MAVGEADTGANAVADEVLLARVRVQLHYLLGDFFLASDWLAAGRARLATLPLIVVQGRRDLVCPPLTAYTLTNSWPGSQLRIVADGGHSALHPAMSAALVQATEDIKQIFTA